MKYRRENKEKFCSLVSYLILDKRTALLFNLPKFSMKTSQNDITCQVLSLYRKFENKTRYTEILHKICNKNHINFTDAKNPKLTK